MFKNLLIDDDRKLLLKAVGSFGGLTTLVKTLSVAQVVLLLAAAVVILVLVMVWQVFVTFRDTSLPDVCRAFGEWLIERIRALGSAKTDDSLQVDEPPKVDEPADVS